MSANDDVIERIARLIYDADALRPRLTWERLTPLTQGEYRKEARSALTAFPLAEANTARLDELERENARLLEAVQKIHNHLSDYIDAKKTVDVSIAVAFEIAREALAGSGEK